MTYNVLMGMLNLTHSLTHLVEILLHRPVSDITIFEQKDQAHMGQLKFRIGGHNRCQYFLHFPTKGWLDGVGLCGWFHSEVVYMLDG